MGVYLSISPLLQQDSLSVRFYPQRIPKYFSVFVHLADYINYILYFRIFQVFFRTFLPSKRRNEHLFFVNFAQCNSKCKVFMYKLHTKVLCISNPNAYTSVWEIEKLHNVSLLLREKPWNDANIVR